MNIVRKYKLSKLSGINYLSDTELEIVNFANSKLLNLFEYTMDKYPDRVFYMDNDGESILEYNIENGCLWVRYIDFWEVLENLYLLDYTDIQIIIQYMVKSAYKLNIKTTMELPLQYKPR